MIFMYLFIKKMTFNIFFWTYFFYLLIPFGATNATEITHCIFKYIDFIGVNF